MEVDINSLVFTTITISIPEATNTILVAILLLREYKFFYEKNIEKNLINLLLFAAIPYAAFANVIFYFDIDIYIRWVINACVMSFLLFNMLGYFGKTDFIKEFIISLKTFVCSLCSIGILLVIEDCIIYIPEYIFGFEVLLLKEKTVANYLQFMLIQMVMFFIIYYNYVKINTSNFIMLNTIWKEKLFKKTILAQIMINILLFVIIYDRFIKNSFLNGLNQDAKTFVVFLIITILVIGNFLPWFVVLTLKLKQRKALEEDLL